MDIDNVPMCLRVRIKKSIKLFSLLSSVPEKKDTESLKDQFVVRLSVF